MTNSDIEVTEITPEVIEPAAVPLEPKQRIAITASQVAVDREYYWIKIDEKHTPRGVKMQLLGHSGVAVYGKWNGESWFTHWAPLPTRVPV